MTTSSISIRKLIDQTQAEYEKCWDFLASWKDGDRKPSRDEILDFQPRLASAIFNLGEIHEKIARERTSLISRKNSLKPNWFKQRMKRLAAFQNALSEAIKIGRVIGDSFAWMFYQGERNRLRKHYLHEPIFKIPAGIGGRGELAFIKKFGIFNGHLLIYHGITSFLRIGDVSFWNPASNAITAIGELKTGPATESGFGVRLYLIWPESSEALWPRAKDHTDHLEMSNSRWRSEQHLGKQLKAMTAWLNLPRFKHVCEERHEMHFDEFNKVAERLKEKSSVVVKAGDGLLLVGLRHSQKQSLFTQLLPKRQVNLNQQLNGIEEHARGIIDMTQVGSNNTNSFFIGTLDLVAFPGTAPILWWPVSSGFAREMIFHEVTITAIYNPAHLIRKLKAAGYDVNLKRTTMVVSRMINDSSVVFSNIDHILVYVQRHLLREESVIKIFQRILDRIKQENLSPNTRIDLDTQLFY